MRVPGFIDGFYPGKEPAKRYHAYAAREQSTITTNMVQTRRRAQLCGARSLLRLPTDVLFKIASHTVAPAFVVAAGKSVETRTALRKGTDAAERSRFGGIGLTVREAEQVLRTRFAHRVDDSDLATRQAAGRALEAKMICYATEDDPEGAPENDDNWLYANEDEQVFISSGLVTALIAYGADPDVLGESGCTVLHAVAEYAPRDAISLARLLLAAGADIDAECAPGNTAGRSPLSWCIVCQPVTETNYELATFLIEQGCSRQLLATTMWSSIGQVVRLKR